MSVNHSASTGCIIGVSPLSFSKMKVCCVLSLESPLEAILMSTHNIPYQYIIKITRKYPKYNNVYSYANFCQALKNEFEIAVVNEPSVFEPTEVLLYVCTL